MTAAVQCRSSPGRSGRERVHFEAPAAERLDSEMRTFSIGSMGNAETDWVVKAGLAHLWFVTIHPFDDGNGRIARAIADLALARSEQSPQRFYSMSAQIRQERADYYDILERTQKATMDITPWMDWFLECLGRAIEGAEATLGTVSPKRAFGRPWAFPLKNASVLFSTACSMASRGSSPHEMGEAREMFTRHRAA